MPYLGITVKKEACAICKKTLTVGSRVFHDPSKSVGSHLAHEKCWIDLRTSRGSVVTKSGPKKSDAELDAPF